MRYIGVEIWRRIKEEISIWRESALPGIPVIALIIFARLIGFLQPLELFAFDYLLKLRPAEPTDERILIVGINEGDIQKTGKYPIPDGELAALLAKLQTYKPSAIGLDLFRNLPVEPGHAKLVEKLKNSKNVIGIEKVLPDQMGFIIPHPPAFSPKQIGFADIILDNDGYLRRSLLGTADVKGEYKFSLSVRLAEVYLSGKNISLQNGIHDPNTMRFGNTELPRFLSNSGGYIRADDGGFQTLLNYRSGRKPFRIVSLQDVSEQKIPPEWIQDKIILIGIVAPSVQYSVNTAAIDSTARSVVSSVEIQAHAVSQIVSTVLDGRPLLNTWSNGWEYLWIVCFGLLGVSLSRAVPPLKIILRLGIISFILIITGYGLLIMGWWIPVVPEMLALIINGVTVSLFYSYQQDIKTRIKERQFIIEITFETIHNGPLQTLAKILKRIKQEKLPSEELYPELEKLNKDLRGIYDFVRQVSQVTSDSSLYLSSNSKLDLNTPIHEILYNVYKDTITRDLSGFKTIKLHIVNFQPIDSRSLSIQLKRELCRFLEEALLNAGKYAEGMTCLDVACTQNQGLNIIRVTDNGSSIDSLYQNHQYEGFGTQQALKLARKLGGKFQRFPNSPKGTICELTWRAKISWFWKL